MNYRLVSIAAALLASTAAISPAGAQTWGPVRDENGVDLVRRNFLLRFVEGSIGSGPSELSLVRINGSNQSSNWDMTFTRVTTSTQQTITISLPNWSSDKFTGNLAATSFTSVYGTGGTLTGDDGSYVYRSADGTTISFEDPIGIEFHTNFCSHWTGANETCILVPTSIAYPNGATISLTNLPVQLSPTTYEPKLLSVNNSYGYGIDFTYQSATSLIRTGAQFTNSAAPSNPVATVGYAYPSGTSAGIIDVTDMAENSWRVTATSIRRPGEATPYWQASSLTNVASVTKNGITTNYARTVSGNVATTTVTNALSQQTIIVSDLTIGRPTAVTDALNRTTAYQYDSFGRLTRIIQPEGNYTQFTYDARGNVTETRQVAKSGSGLADIVALASFDASCANPVKCNQPNTTTDPRGNVTNYSYDATHGGVTAVTLPAPAVGTVRPETRYSYTLLNGEYFLTGMSQCQTLASCAGTSDESKATLVYNASGNATSISQGDGSGTLTATSTMTYDASGNLQTVDGPLSGTADTTRYRYDAARRQIGAIGPDPDAAGSLKHRAVKTSYNVAGIATKQEVGTVNSQSDPDWANFAPLEALEIGHDANMRAVTQKLTSGGTIYALTQTSYDTLGRVDCVATRMNTAIYGSLPSSACTLGTQGSDGPDRITKSVYDAAGQITQQQVALGTADQANERTLTYTSNAKVQTVKDGEDNLTTYEYDGFDRLAKTRMPNTTKGSGTSSGTDYEQLSYDEAGNVTNDRLRDAANIGFAYDNLNRVTLKNLPGSEPDVTYAYDNLGRLTSASQTGNSLSFSYDALGRNLTQVGPQGTATSEWDLAGRRTKLTYPGAGLYLNYDYLVTGEVTKIRENGAVFGIGVLATYGYDDLGRRTSLTFGNGASQAYGYDPVSRLASLTNNLTGTANDLAQALSYNPAGQIVSNVRTGDAYAWTAHYNENRNYTSNGLNQLTASGAIIPTYDSRGNLTSAGNTTYAYSSENMLVSATGGTSASLVYDPMVRLYQLTAGASTTRFAYDGLAMIAEYDGSNALLRRHVFGPGMDQPIVWYEGSGTADRRFLGSDERGSIVSVSDGSGNMLTLNSYDEYGIPGLTNAGRFQYTGQAWLPEIGVQYSKARLFSPTLGRFLQTDPIGYEGGLNIYAYVGNDPVNWMDPLGLCGFNEARVYVGSAGYFDSNGDAVIRAIYRCVPSYDGPWIGVIDKVNVGGGVSRTKPQNDHCSAAGSSNLRNFLWGAGDAALMGFGDELRDALGIAPVDMNSSAYLAGEITGSVALLATGVGGGIRAAGVAGKGLEFSHFIPARMGGARSIWNGNFVSTATHALSDPFRYRFMPRSWKAGNPMPSRANQLWVRTPNTIKGTAAGAGAAGTGLARAGC